MSLDVYLNEIRSTDINVRTAVGFKLINHLKTKNSPLSCENVKLIIDSVVSWLRSSNHKIALSAIEILSLFAIRMKASFKSYVSSIVTTSIDKLGDQRANVQEKLRELIISMIDISGYRIIVGYLEPAFTHRLSRIRHQALIIIHDVINIYGFEEFLMSKSIPSICSLLNDSSLEIQEMATKVLVTSYEKFGSRVRTLVNRQPRLSSQKISLINEHFSSTECQVQPKPTLPKSAPRVFSSVKSRVPQYDAKEAGAVDEDMFIEAFEQFVPIVSLSNKDLQEKLAKMKASIGNSSADWEVRVQALKQLRYLAENDPPELILDSGCFRSWALPLKASLSDLRSQVARESAITISFLAVKFCNKFSNMAEIILPTVIHLIQNSAKVISSSCIVCANFLIRNVKSHKLLPIVCNGIDNKSHIIKRHASEFLANIIETWPVSILERSLGILETAIQKGIDDSDVQARISSRRSFWYFSSYFVKEGQLLYNKLDQNRQKGVRTELTNIATLPNNADKHDLVDKICAGMVPVHRSVSIDRKIPRPGTFNKNKSYVRTNSTLGRSRAISYSDVSIVSTDSVVKPAFVRKVNTSVHMVRSTSLHDRSSKETIDSDRGSAHNFADLPTILSMLTNKVPSDRRMGLGHLGRLIENGIDISDAQIEEMMKIVLKMFQDTEMCFPTCFSVCKQIVSKYSGRFNPLLVRLLLQQLLVKLVTKTLPSTEANIKLYLNMLPQFFSLCVLNAAVYQLMKDNFIMKSCNMMNPILEFLVVLINSDSLNENMDDEIFCGILEKIIEYLRSRASSKYKEMAISFIVNCRGQFGDDFTRVVENMPREHIDTVNYVLSNYFMDNEIQTFPEEFLQEDHGDHSITEVTQRVENLETCSSDESYLNLVLNFSPDSITPDQFKTVLSKTLSVLSEELDPSCCSLALKVIQFLLGNFPVENDDLVRIVEVLVKYYSDEDRFKELKNCPCIKMVLKISPSDLILNTLINQVNKSEILKCPLKMLFMVIRSCTAETLIAHMNVLVETLTKTLKNGQSVVRMNTVYCLVSMYNVLGNDFYQYFPLDHLQLKLVKLYVDRDKKYHNENNIG